MEVYIVYFSKNKKRSVMIHMQEEARDAGVEIPENFEVFKSFTNYVKCLQKETKKCFLSIK